MGVASRWISSVLWIASAGLAVAGPVCAASNPSLFAEVDGIEDEAHTKPLHLSRLAIDVTIEGSLAETSLTATFAGLPNEESEGHFALALPENAVVNGYALDIDDEMISGVLVARPKAIEVYSAKVRRAIDPGLAEVSSSNVFRTQVYPILAQSGRTIRVSFVTPLHRELVLPLITEASIDEFDLKITAREVTRAPAIELPSGIEASWQRTRRGAYVATVSTTNVQLSGALTVAPTNPRKAAIVGAHHSGQRFFQIRDALRPSRLPTPRPQRVRVYWDSSLSRRDDRLDAEIALLERYAHFAAGVPIDLVTFNSTAATLSSSDSFARLRAELESLQYRGGTSFAVIDTLRLPPADVCMLFSDGAATIDRRDTFKPDCTLKAITSALDADRGYLAALTRESGGVVVRLTSESQDAAYRRLIEEQPIIVDASTPEGRPLDFTMIENGSEGWFVVGEAPRNGEIVLEVRNRRGARLENRYYSRSVRSSDFNAPAALWAADRIAALVAAERDVKEVERVVRRYSIPSPHHAFVVLERPDDYADAEVTPPKGYPQEAFAEYLEAKAERDAWKREERTDHLAYLYEAWHQQKQWWADEYESLTEASRSVKNRLRDDRFSGRHRSSGNGSGSLVGSNLEEVIVTGSFIRANVAESPMPIAIRTFPLDRRYLQTLEGIGADQLDEAIAEQQREHGTVPAFYLDLSEWLYRQGEVTRATEMLLAALELPLSNDETKALVADRLVRYGYVDRGIWLYEQVARVSDHRPQPKIQLALALAKRATVRSATAKRDLQKAIALLNEVAMTPWGEEYEGIAVSALMEANALIPRYRKFGGSRVVLDPNLVALLDLDLRVVINWSTAATDLDLWVDEPSGERAIYSNSLTSIGGLLPVDMTQGYGPEEYLLREAAPGEYRIHIDVFAADVIDPNGPTTVTARLIHDFGRPTEREQSVDIELSRDDIGEKYIASIRVGGTE